MNLACNRKNLALHAKDLLGNEWTPEAEAALVKECLTGFDHGHYGHVSHARAEHLERINAILKSHGVEGMLLDGEGNDVSGECDESLVEVDVQYVNAGDSYAPTILYRNGHLRIGDWGSLVESLV